MNRDFKPTSFEEFISIFYGTDYERKRRILSWNESTIVSPAMERYVQRIFSPFCDLEKIKETKRMQTYDFKSDDSKLLVGVKLLQVDTSHETITRMTTADVLRKLRSKVGQILNKDASQFPTYRKGGALIYTQPFDMASRFREELTKEFPNKFPIFNVPLDFMAFFPLPAVSKIRYSSAIYVKDTALFSELKDAFQTLDAPIFSV